MRKTAYLRHPVSAEVKADHVGRGFRIIDVRFEPETLGPDDISDNKPKSKPKKEKASGNDPDVE